jgi:hypothetical protein
LKRERRQPTRAEGERITPSKPVVRILKKRPKREEELGDRRKGGDGRDGA